MTLIDGVEQVGRVVLGACGACGGMLWQEGGAPQFCDPCIASGAAAAVEQARVASARAAAEAQAAADAEVAANDPALRIAELEAQVRELQEAAASHV